MKAFAPILCAATLAACSPQPAATGNTAEPANHAAMNHQAMSTTASDSPATRGYKQSMTAMMSDAPAYTGDPDIDFMQQMRVHHVAAVAMAQTELTQGNDPAARALAQAVIAAQQQEIEQIDRWLRAKGR